MRSRCFRGLPSQSPVVFFLPWHTSYWMAQRLGLIGSHYTACYELAPAPVSSEPDQCIEAVNRLIEDAEQVLAASGTGEAISPSSATAWQLARHLAGEQAGRQVFAVAAAAMQGYHPVENLDRLAAGSTFTLSRTDPFIPWQRTSELIAAIRQHS